MVKTYVDCFEEEARTCGAAFLRHFVANFEVFLKHLGKMVRKYHLRPYLETWLCPSVGILPIVFKYRLFSGVGINDIRTKEQDELALNLY